MELNRIEEARLKLQSQGKEIINLSSGNPGEFGIRFPQEILSRGFKDFQNNPIYFPDPKGNIAARKAVQAFYLQRGVDVSLENILLTSGSSESYLHLFKLLACNNDEILFPNPSYPLFDHLASLANIRLNHYQLDPSNDWQVNLQDLEAKISEKTKAIVLVSPNNPTGGVLTRETLTAIFEIAQRHNIAIISDEVFSEFIFQNDKTNGISFKQDISTFTLNGISKTYALPGLKLSWIVVTGPKALTHIDALELSIDTLLSCNQVSQTLLPYIITEGELFLREYKIRVHQSMNTAIQILAKSNNISLVKPKGGFYLFAQIHNFPGNDEEFAIKMLEEANIFVHPGYFYDYENGLYVLISFLMEAEQLSKTLEKFVEITDLLCRSE